MFGSMAGESGHGPLDADASRVAPPDPVEQVGQAVRGADLYCIIGGEPYGDGGGGFGPGRYRVGDGGQRLDGATAELPGYQVCTAAWLRASHGTSGQSSCSRPVVRSSLYRLRSCGSK